MNKPTVFNYKLAKQELTRLRIPVHQSTLDMHVISQLSDHKFLDMYHDKVDGYEYLSLINELTMEVMPPTLRAEGTGPWKLFGPCDHCSDVKNCGLICSCNKDSTDCDCAMVVEFRAFKPSDMHTVARDGFMDNNALVERLCATGGSVDLDAMPFGTFMVVQSAIQRSLHSPFWLRAPQTIESK